MKYADGSEVKLGDRVRISSGYTGVVVVSIDTTEYDPRFPADDWVDLKTGILILTDTGALAHVEDPLDSRSLTRDRQE
jgi:hypothetical protein